MKPGTSSLHQTLLFTAMLWLAAHAVAEPNPPYPLGPAGRLPMGEFFPVGHKPCREDPTCPGVCDGIVAVSDCPTSCGDARSCPLCPPNGCGCRGRSRRKAAKPDPCVSSHKGLFYANDFGYLKDPDYDGCCLGDSLKLMPVGHCGQCSTLDIGGQMRLRYHHEKGMGQAPGLTRFQNDSNDFLLSRLRLYTNWQINDWTRFYAEGIYAGLDANDNYLPRSNDENYGDLLNIFFDVKLTHSTTVRVGRQELLYGVQRTVAAADWGNSRRRFEGVKVLYRQCDWAIDCFYTNFVPVIGNQFDEADYDRPFYGVYSVYSGLENATLDLYYLGFDNQTVGTPITTDFSLHTLGMRVKGNAGDWLYELEGAPQFGRQSGLGLDHSAGFVTAGIGRKLNQMPWETTVWFYYDYASGNNIGGDFNRYNHLFALGHRYLGIVDATQRANIETPNLLITMQPTKKLSLLLWYYHLMANQDTDIVPSLGGTPAQSTASKDWGDELQIIATYGLSSRSKIQFGWSHFWVGNKIVAANRSDAEFFYTQWMLNF